MKKLSAILFVKIFFISAIFAQKHVVLVTIDGFRPDFYLEEKWDTPNLKQLKSLGIYARGVNSVFPSVTYPSHTTIVTGVQPSEHGITSNALFEPDSVTGKIYWNFNQITAPTVWEAAKKKGLKVASMLWPVSAEAPIDINISDIGSMGENVRRSYAEPKGITDSIRSLLFPNQEVKWGEDEFNAPASAHIIRQYKPHLMTIHLISVDHAEHTTGRDGKAVYEAIHHADQGIGLIRDAIKDAGMEDSTLLIVTGDHGFYDVTQQVNPNIWLVREGLLNPDKKADWKAQFFAVGGSAFLFLKDKQDTVTRNRVLEMLNNLPENEKKCFRIIHENQMKEIGANPSASFALSGLQGTSFGNSFVGESMKEGKGGTHGHFPDTQPIQTGFIAIGPKLKQGVSIDEMDLKDVTMFVKEYLQLDMPAAEGRSSQPYFE